MGRAIAHGIRARGNADQTPDAPAWLTAGVNEWATISGTTPPYGLNDYSGLGFRDDGTVTESLCALGGGHNGNVTRNDAHVIDYTAAAPSWQQVKANGNFTGYDSATMVYLPSDGSPGPRHLYNAICWFPGRGDYVFGGRYYAAGGSDNATPATLYASVDGFNRATNSWRAQDYYPDKQGSYFMPWSVVDPSTGIMYASEGDDSSAIGGYQLDPSTLTMSAWHSSAGTRVVRGPNAWDTNRGKCFQLGPRNYEFWSGTIVAATIGTDGTKTAITFNSSAAYTAWSAEVANYLSPAMVYDRTGDCFYWYNGDDGRGASGTSNRIYKITPNGTTTWDMSIIDGTGVTPPANRSGIGGWDGTKFTSGTFSGTNSQLGFVDRWGVLLLVRPSANVHYMRVR